MKSVFFPYLLLFLLFFITACSDEDTDVNIDMNDGKYTFHSFSSSESQWQPYDEIGISVYKAGSNEIYSGNNNKTYRTTKGYFFYPVLDSDRIFFPITGEAVDFVAYFPYQANLLDNKFYHIDLRNQTEQRQIDLLYSSNAKGIDKSSVNPNLVFEHPLSKIVVYSSAGETILSSDLEGMTIEINGIHAQAKFNLHNGQMDTMGVKTSIQMCTDTLNLRNEAILLPGSANGVSFSVKLANGNQHQADLSKILHFEPQTIHYFSVVVNRKGIEIQPYGVADWEECEDGSEVTIPPQRSIYQVGDFYPNPQDLSTAIGVVYWISPGSDGYNGKIVSFDTSMQSWSSFNTQSIKAESLAYGTINLQIAQLINPELDLFPAFLWCVEKGDGWYLPARYELHIMQEEWNRNREAINSSIRLAGGEEIGSSDVYLTSTESKGYPTDQAESYSFFDKSWPAFDKTSSQRVRAVKQF